MRRRTQLSWLFAALVFALLVGGDARVDAQTGPSLRSFYLLGAASTNATVVSGCKPTKLYSADLFSLDATPVYVRLYNLCRTPTEADTPVLVLAVPGVPATTSASLGQTFYRPSAPLHFSTGLAIRTTTGIAVDNTDAVSANEVIVNLSYTP